MVRSIQRGIALAFAVILVSLTACVGFGPQGGIFTSTKVGVYGTEAGGAKKGSACAFSILGLLALGDGSVQAASDKGGIKTVKTIDLEGFSVLGIYSELCTVVNGD